ncbi:MAG: helix-turn-helix transcriptional regulator [Clostridia bacterium]|nr:helix-turn-helix transcriptional regulator [Clostridia bacterium]
MKIIYTEKYSDNMPIVLGYGTGAVSEHEKTNLHDRKATHIYYILSGECCFNNKKIAEGQGFLVPADIPYILTEVQGAVCTYFLVSLSGKEAHVFCQKHLEIDEHGVFSYAFKEKLHNLLNNFFNEIRTIDVVKSTSLFMQLLLWHEGKEKTKNTNHFVELAKAYMQRNLHRSVSIKEVAESLFISDRYLYKLFIKHEKVSPKKYMTQMKLQQACIMLQNGSYNISAIAQSLGFDDVYLFSRFFSRGMQMSPSDYQKRI